MEQDLRIDFDLQWVFTFFQELAVANCQLLHLFVLPLVDFRVESLKQGQNEKDQSLDGEMLLSVGSWECSKYFLF